MTVTSSPTWPEKLAFGGDLDPMVGGVLDHVVRRRALSEPADGPRRGHHIAPIVVLAGGELGKGHPAGNVTDPLEPQPAAPTKRATTVATMIARRAGLSFDGPWIGFGRAFGATQPRLPAGASSPSEAEGRPE